MVDAGSDNARFVEGDLAFHQAIYLATHNEFFWPLAQLFGVSLKQMFHIAATGSHRPRAIVEHNDVLRAIVEHKPELARAAAITLLGNAVEDIRLIRGEASTPPDASQSAGQPISGRGIGKGWRGRRCHRQQRVYRTTDSPGAPYSADGAPTGKPVRPPDGRGPRGSDRPWRERDR